MILALLADVVIFDRTVVAHDTGPNLTALTLAILKRHAVNLNCQSLSHHSAASIAVAEGIVASVIGGAHGIAHDTSHSVLHLKTLDLVA